MIFWNFLKRVFSIDTEGFKGDCPGLSIFDGFGKLHDTDDLKVDLEPKITLVMINS